MNEKNRRELTSLSQALPEAVHQFNEPPEQNGFDQEGNQSSGDGGGLQGVRFVLEPFLHHLQFKPNQHLFEL